MYAGKCNSSTPEAIPQLDGPFAVHLFTTSTPTHVNETSLNILPRRPSKIIQHSFIQKKLPSYQPQSIIIHYKNLSNGDSSPFRSEVTISGHG